jgi:hypothetical protein
MCCWYSRNKSQITVLQNFTILWLWHWLIMQEQTIIFCLSLTYSLISPPSLPLIFLDLSSLSPSHIPWSLLPLSLSYSLFLDLSSLAPSHIPCSLISPPSLPLIFLVPWSLLPVLDATDGIMDAADGMFVAAYVILNITVIIIIT